MASKTQAKPAWLLTQLATDPNDNAFHPLKAVATTIQGMLYCAPVVKVKGEAWVWLTADLQGYVLRCVPADRHWRFADRALSTIKSRYPRAALGWAADHCGRNLVGLNSGEDALIHAGDLLAAMADLDAEKRYGVSVVKWSSGADGARELARLAADA